MIVTLPSWLKILIFRFKGKTKSHDTLVNTQNIIRILSIPMIKKKVI